MKHLFYFSIILSFLSLQCSVKQNKVDPQKPNIIYILADDLGYGELGVYGQNKIETPNIDKLAQAGMLFTQHYTGAPVCAPARAVLLTGLHSGHSYIRGNDEWNERGNVWNYKAVALDSTLEGQRPLPDSTVTIAKLLKKAGYRTGMAGKWGLGAPHSQSIPTKMGFDYFIGYNCQRQAHTYNPLHLYENERRIHLTKNDTIAPGTKLQAGEDPNDPNSYKRYKQDQYSPEFMFDKILGFLNEDSDDPFFLYWASPIPHAPLQAPQKWIDYYVSKFGEEEAYTAERKKGSYNSGYFPTRYPRASYAAMVTYLDENIGKMIQQLKENNEYENTIIIFSSDNGPTYNGGTDSPWFDSAKPFKSEYGRGKGFVYEGGIRVPMIASWPGKIKAGSKSEHISAFYDVMPTLCEIAGVEESFESDGISFVPSLLQDKNQQSHPYLYWEYPEYGGQLAIRMDQWKIIWKDIKKKESKIELYDLSNDPIEQNDLSEKHPEILEKFWEIIKKEHKTPEVDRFRMQALEDKVNQ